MWWVKSRRAQSDTDYETWIEGGVVPTLNVFDNATDTRAVVVVVMRQREGKPGGGKGPLLSEDKSLTIATANDQILFVTQGVWSVREDAKANTFSATPADTALTVNAHQPSVQSHHAQLFIAQEQEVKPTAYAFDSLSSNSMKSSNPISGCREVSQSKTVDTAALNPSANQGGIAITQEQSMEQPIAFSHTQGLDASEDGTGPGTPITVFQQSSMSGKGTLGVDDDAQVSKPVKTQNDGQMIAVTLKASDDAAVAVDLYNNTLSDTNQSLRAAASDVSKYGAVLEPQTIVRRLTPTECERLQGFPDNWTAERIDHKTGQVVDQKDSARYKQMGNAVAVPCVEWIINRLIETDTNV